VGGAKEQICGNWTAQHRTEATDRRWWSRRRMSTGTELPWLLMMTFCDDDLGYLMPIVSVIVVIDYLNSLRFSAVKHAQQIPPQMKSFKIHAAQWAGVDNDLKNDIKIMQNYDTIWLWNKPPSDCFFSVFGANLGLQYITSFHLTSPVHCHSQPSGSVSIILSCFISQHNVTWPYLFDILLTWLCK